MTSNLYGPTFVLFASALSSVVHLVAARDPERNWFTRSLKWYYELPWPLTPKRNGQDVMYAMFAGSVLIAVLALAAFVYELTRAAP